MGQETCRMHGCEEERKYGKFCSKEHEIKYEHLKADARDARRADEPEPEPDLPEYDGPPY